MRPTSCGPRSRTCRATSRRSGTASSPPEPEVFDSLREEVDRLTRLAVSLDVLAGEDRQRALPGPVELDALVRVSADLVAPALARRSILLDVSAEPGLVVHGRADELTQVLANLLQNAVRYTPAGGRVRVTAARSPEGVTVQVSNSGPGIPSDDLPHVWERFYRVEKSRDRARGGAGSRAGDREAARRGGRRPGRRSLRRRLDHVLVPAARLIRLVIRPSPSRAVAIVRRADPAPGAIHALPRRSRAVRRDNPLPVALRDRRARDRRDGRLRRPRRPARLVRRGPAPPGPDGRALAAAVVVLAPAAWYLGSPLFVRTELQEPPIVAVGPTPASGRRRRATAGRGRADRSRRHRGSTPGTTPAGHAHCRARRPHGSLSRRRRLPLRTRPRHPDRSPPTAAPPFGSTTSRCATGPTSTSTCRPIRPATPRARSSWAACGPPTAASTRRSRPAPTSTGARSVVIWCREFAVLFAVAPLDG